MTNKINQQYKLDKKVLILAGGTGGHIFPALALAQQMQQQGWAVHWLGAKGSLEKPSMESKLVPQYNLPISYIDFAGVRGKSKFSLLSLPWRLLKALVQSRNIIKQQQPDLIVGFGGYVSFPAGVMSYLLRIPLVIHEQNAVAGTANKKLAPLATKVFTTFPAVLAKGIWVGSPIRNSFFTYPAPAQRLAQRSGPLRLLVLGGSLGARALNQILPQAIALLPQQQRPQIIHQSGEQHLAELSDNYAAAAVAAQCVGFITDVAQEMAQADLLICRAGATTIAEITSLGAAAILVPLPNAIDDHQTKNAQFLAEKQAAWLLPQSQLNPNSLAQLLQSISRQELQLKATAAKDLAKVDAAIAMTQAGEEIIKL